MDMVRQLGMKCEIEHLDCPCSIIRIFDDNKTHGDPYILAATIKWIDHESIEIAGIDVPITITMWKTIREALISIGIKRVLIVRWKNGQPHHKWLQADVI